MDSKDTILEGAEQISSIQELHKTIQVITIRGWVALAFVFLFSIVSLFWAFAGRLPISVDGKCILIEESTVYAFFPLFSGQQVKEGMEGYISLDSIDSSKFGKIEGVVRQVISYPVSLDDPLMKEIPSNSLRKYLLEGSVPNILTVISLQKDPETKSGLKWTTTKGPRGSIPKGSVGEAQVILRTVKPISYVLPES